MNLSHLWNINDIADYEVMHKKASIYSSLFFHVFVNVPLDVHSIEIVEKSSRLLPPLALRKSATRTCLEMM